MTQELSVHPARADDIPFIRTLEEEAFGFTWDEPTFLRELTRENGLTSILRLGEQAIGSALLVWAADEAQLNSIAISPDYRGRGFSSVYLGNLLKYCQLRGMAWTTLEVKWSNEPAHRLYRGFGFVTTARRPKYYRDGQDARIMWAGHLQSPFHLARLGEYGGLVA